MTSPGTVSLLEYHFESNIDKKKHTVDVLHLHQWLNLNLFNPHDFNSLGLRKCDAVPVLRNY